ncbi:hypothetical protein [Mucilaginibacter terrae]|uniref:Uncharacterized protein n=1 Tax=Mucilaginibacter terrae TaxID=1955052 RepID=A0ABU3GXK5_9SPHI|nr:hypothetical protein [Mucilaginibacter terrae]MDT3404504.1 hypothetical protein [Mucilaginibacter terrae]
MSIHQHPMIFCTTFENHNTDCILQNRTVPTDILKETFAALSVQLRADPKTIVLYDINTATYNHDPID